MKRTFSTFFVLAFLFTTQTQAFEFFYEAKISIETFILNKIELPLEGNFLLLFEGHKVAVSDEKNNFQYLASDSSEVTRPALGFHFANSEGIIADGTHPTKEELNKRNRCRFIRFNSPFVVNARLNDQTLNAEIPIHLIAKDLRKHALAVLIDRHKAALKYNQGLVKNPLPPVETLKIKETYAQAPLQVTLQSDGSKFSDGKPRLVVSPFIYRLTASCPELDANESKSDE